MKNKKEALGGVIIIVLLILVLVTYLTFYNYRKENKKEIKLDDNSTSFIYIYNNNSILKVEDLSKVTDTKDVIGKYNCKYDDCDIFNTNIINPIYDNKYILLKENNEIFIYNFTEEKVASEKYTNLVNRKNNYILVEKDNKYGLIDIDGKKLIDTIYDEIDVNVYNNLTKVKSNNLYGIYDVKENKEIIKPKYENINISDVKYYSVKLDDKWYVIDSNDKLISNGYTYVFAFNKGFIAQIDNNLHILKYSNEIEQLYEETIPVEENYEIIRNNGIIKISLNGKIYEYDINRNNLTIK